MVRDLEDKQKAADKLGRLSDNLQTICDKCDEAVEEDQEEDEEKRKGIKRLVKKFDPKKLTENIPGSSYVAYSVNKGDELSICIRKKGTEEFIKDNTVIFVAIHELAHIMTKSTGHTDEFWDNMNYLLNKASQAGLYEAIDYAKSPADYCGVKITSTPLNM